MKERTPGNYLFLFNSSCALSSYFTESTILGLLFYLSSYKVCVNFKAIYMQTYFLLFSPYCGLIFQTNNKSLTKNLNSWTKLHKQLPRVVLKIVSCVWIKLLKSFKTTCGENSFEDLAKVVGDSIFDYFFIGPKFFLQTRISSYKKCLAKSSFLGCFLK